jgi:protoheme ferro-lyase
VTSTDGGTLHDWCDHCDAESVEVTHKIDLPPPGVSAQFCSVECAARWASPSLQDRIEEFGHKDHQGGTDGD